MDTYGPDDQPQDEIDVPLSPEPTEPPEYLNPWVSIIYRPRETIRYLLDTGVWNNIWIVYAIAFAAVFPQIVVSFLAQPNMDQMPDLPGGLTMATIYGVMLVLILIFGYPVGMLMLYFKAWLYKVVGSWLDGQGAYKELRVTVAWTAVLNTYMNLMMFVPTVMLLIYYQTTDEVTTAAQIVIGLIQVAILLPLTIVYFVIGCKAVGEAHRFSAWKALGTVFISFLLMMAVAIFLVILLLVFIYAIFLAIRLAFTF